MDIDHEEKLLLMEVQTLAAEIMTKTIMILSDENDHDQGRRHMAVASTMACRALDQLIPKDDWLEEFGGNLEAAIEGEEERYEDACFDENRQERLIALANLRVLKTLRRRLTDPRRRQSLKPYIYTDPLYPPGGVLPPGVSFPIPPEAPCPAPPTQDQAGAESE